MCLPESSAKAVADGAVAWYIRQSVKGRAARFAYGISIRVPYDRNSSKHEGRQVHQDNVGDYVLGVWSAIVAKVSLFDIILLVSSSSDMIG
jgi:hypothetical protein